MPNYTFKCKTCDEVQQRTMTLSAYREFDSPCTCGGELEQLLTKVKTKIERRKEELLEQARAEADEIVKRINNGDIELLKNVAGDTLDDRNKHVKEMKDVKNGSFTRAT